MIERLQRIATFLSRLRLLLVVFALGSIGVMILSVVDNPLMLTDEWLIPATTAMLWSLSLYSLSYLFLNVPSAPDSSMGWRERMSTKIRRAGLWLLGLAFVGLSIMILLLSYQLLRVYFM
ncbi:MAG: hypothetical protein AAF438_18910 [Pseudomonadota bacterium]